MLDDWPCTQGEAELTDLIDLAAWLGASPTPSCAGSAALPTGPLAAAEPKTLRWGLWHTPARIVRHARQQIVRILDGWPSEQALLDGYQRVALII